MEERVGDLPAEPRGPGQRHRERVDRVPAAQALGELLENVRRDTAESRLMLGDQLQRHPAAAGHVVQQPGDLEHVVGLGVAQPFRPPPTHRTHGRDVRLGKLVDLFVDPRRHGFRIRCAPHRSRSP